MIFLLTVVLRSFSFLTAGCRIRVLQISFFRSFNLIYFCLIQYFFFAIFNHSIQYSGDAVTAKDCMTKSCDALQNDLESTNSHVEVTLLCLQENLSKW